MAVKTRERAPASLDSVQRVLEDIWYALSLITAPVVNLPPEVRIPAPMVSVSPAAVHLPAPVVNYRPPDISLPEIHVEPAPWPPELLDAIGAIRDVARREPGAGGGVLVDQGPVLEALGRIEKLLSQQKQSEGRTLGLVPKQPQTAADGSQTVTVNNLPITSLTPLRALISTSASGTSQVVAATANKKIRVLTGFLVAAAAVSVKFQSAITPTDLTGAMPFATNGGLAIPYSDLGQFETIAGEALSINLSGAVAVGGAITYVTV